MGDLYEELITSSLKAEDERRTTHTTQGVAIISASGVLTTLLAGLTAVLRTGGMPLPVASRILLAVALSLFTAAAIAALLGMSPGPYYGLDPEYLRQKVTREGWDEWAREPLRATWEIQVRRVEFLDQAHKLNTQRGRFIQTAIGVEALGVIVLVVGTIVLVLS